MYVIRGANGNIYPVDRSVFRMAEATGGGYKLTHFTPNAASVATNANPAAATAGDELGYLGKSGRFVAISEPAT
tara:strand:+ start:953 stop:1174 length:222 start_codon:yes stop_codon:yes gene_type:complete